MGLWGKPGEWKPAARASEKPATGKKTSGHRLARGEPDEMWCVSFCLQHGFTQAKFIRAVDESTSIFKADCGCEITHGGFYVEADDGRVLRAKIRNAT